MQILSPSFDVLLGATGSNADNYIAAVFSLSRLSRNHFNTVILTLLLRLLRRLGKECQHHGRLQA